MATLTLEEQIRAIPGDDGWWHEDGWETYKAVGRNLTGMGWSAEQIIEILSMCYSAGANEFGGE